jgi:hypothetical protein
MGLRQGALTVSWILDANGNLYGTAGQSRPERSRGGSRAQYFELI